MRGGGLEVHYALLGELEVTRDDGTDLPISQARFRTLLTIFLVHPNKVLTADKILQLRGPEDVPRCGTHLVHSYVSGLRRELMPKRPLTNQRPGYRFEVGPAELDLWEFRELVALGTRLFRGGDFLRAAAYLRSACALWRDPELPAFPESLAMKAAAGQLVREFHVARDLCTDAEIAIGHCRELIPELHARTYEDPALERSWAQLILVQYRSGLRAAALETYLHARATILDLAGVEPGLALQQLHRLMLRDDPDLYSPAILAVLN
jgi:DNA-binding SARP family transcriptional activator